MGTLQIVQVDTTSAITVLTPSSQGYSEDACEVLGKGYALNKCLLNHHPFSVPGWLCFIKIQLPWVLESTSFLRSDEQ